MKSRHSHRFGTSALILAALVWTGGGPARLAAGESFQFKRFCALAAGESFGIIALNGYAAGTKIGQGRVQKLSPRELRMDFTIRTVASGEIRGRLDLEYLGARDRFKERLRLSYSGQTPDGPESATEIVAADSFLIQNGILALYFSDRRRFFQLSIDSRGRSKFISHWGASRLEATR